MEYFNFKFTVQTVEDAILTRAACDAIIQTATRERFAKASAPFGTGNQERDNSIHTTDPQRADDSEETVIENATAPEPGLTFAGLPVVKMTVLEPDMVAAPEQEDATDGDDESSEYSKAQIKEAAAHDPELAALASKKGKKTAETKLRIQELTARYYVTTHGRTFTEAPAQPEEPREERAIAPNPLSGLSAAQLNDMLNRGCVVEQAVAVETASKPTGLAALDPDLASISASHVTQQPQAEPEPAKAAEISAVTLANLSQKELADKIVDLADNGHGYGWFTNVIRLGGGKVGNMPVDFMRKVVENPDAYYPQN